MDLPPEWVQVIITSILVGVTIVYAWSTHKMAKANQDMATAALKQVEFNEKGNSRRVVVDMAKNTYGEIYRSLKDAKILLISRSPFTPNNDNISDFPSITPILNSQVHLPDEILKKYNAEIHDYAKKYEQYIEEKNRILTCILDKTPTIWDKFVELCRNLKEKSGKFGGADRPDVEQVYAILLTSMDIDKENRDYDFIEQNKDTLLDFLNENGFSEDIKEYKQLKGEFSIFIDQFLELLDKLFKDWQIEYLIVDSEFKDNSFYYI